MNYALISFDLHVSIIQLLFKQFSGNFESCRLANTSHNRSNIIGDVFVLGDGDCGALRLIVKSAAYITLTYLLIYLLHESARLVVTIIML